MRAVNGTLQHTVSFSEDDSSQGAEYQVFLGVFLMFLAFFHSKIWAKFHLGTLNHISKKKVLKYHSQNR